MKNNKHAFEHTLTLKERQVTDEYGEPTTLSPMKEKVWAKDKTITAGIEFIGEYDYKAPYMIETTDLKMKFAEIHVGSAISELEKFLGATSKQIQGFDFVDSRKGLIFFRLLDPDVSMKVEGLSIYHNGKNIIKMAWEDYYVGGGNSSQTKKFIQKMEQQLGL